MQIPFQTLHCFSALPHSLHDDKTEEFQFIFSAKTHS